MFEVEGYSNIRLIHQGRKHYVYRARQDASGDIMALKTPATLLPAARELAVLEKEYGCLTRLEVANSPAAKELLDTGQSLVLVMTYFNYATLRMAIDGQLPSIPEAVSLFMRLVRIVGDLHQQGITHKDITPANILYHRGTGDVALVDFGAALDVPQQTFSCGCADWVDGTFAYMSPEQTGRMNRPLDYRTDFYTLGVTMYEALAGTPPFTGEDLGEMVHCHIAVDPVPLRKANPEVPTALSNIVMKCLSKGAADRYQSADGLFKDLERCKQSLEETGEIQTFPLGVSDVSDRFVFPDRLFGREKEFDQLLRYYREGISDGTVIMVSGHSGVGKTSLVSELNRVVAAEYGYVSYGKYDQYNRSTPYSGLVQAFSGLLKQILTQSNQRIEKWRTRILEAVGDNASVLIDVIPELGVLLGKQPKAAPLSLFEARTRFSTVFSQFVQCIGSMGHPIVVFLDDLHWVDSSSLSLIETFGSVKQSVSIVFLGAYRSNEVSESHPLATTLSEMKAKGARVDELSLTPLQGDVLQAYMSELLGVPAADVLAASAIIFEKTGGNPLYFKTLLTSQYEAGHIRFNYEAARWDWDEEALRTAPYAEAVVDALQARLETLPGAVLETLKLGALAGSPFSLDFLVRLSGRTRSQVAWDMKQAIAFGVVTPDGQGFDLYARRVADKLDNIQYSFSHDRLQQAAYALLEEERRPALHLEAGRMLMLVASECTRCEYLFDIVDHMRKGKSLLAGQDERTQVADVVLHAGVKAKSSTAFADAANLLEFARELLPEDGWEREYRLVCDVSLELAEALYLAGRYREAEELYDEIRANVSSDNDLLKLYNIQSKQFHHQARFAEAVAIEYQGLALLGIHIPEADEELMPLFTEQSERIAALLADKSPGSYYDSPENIDPILKRKLELLFDLFADGYLMGRGLLCGTVSAIMARLSLENGNNTMASVSYINYASTLCAMGTDYSTGYAFGKLAVRLTEKYRVPALQNYTYHVFSLAVNHWRSPLDTSYKYWLDASKLALASGSPYAGYVFLQLAHVLLASGAPLTDVEVQAGRSYDFLHKSGLDAIVTLLRLIVLQPVKHLTGSTKGHESLDDAYFDTDAFLKENSAAPFFTGSLYYSLMRVAVISGKPLERTVLNEYLEVIDATQQGQIILADSYFYYALQLLQSYPECSVSEQEEHWQDIERAKGRMQVWAELCEHNFRHKFLLLQAERHRIDSGSEDVMDLYDKSIELALRSKFIHDAALAAEKAGDYWLTRGKNHIAKSYIEQAFAYYGRWGADAKLAQLRAVHGSFLMRVATPGDVSFTDYNGESSSLLCAHSLSEELDLASVIKASQAVSRHIVMDDLGAELVTIAVENAGATKGVLILSSGGDFRVCNMVLGASGAVPVNESLEESKLIPHAVVNYVVRTQVPVVIEDVSVDLQFSQSNYMREHKPSSICCLPIQHGSDLRGILYLENEHVVSAFRPERLDTLKILAAQATISMENARMYQQLEGMNKNLENIVAERTAEIRKKNEELNDKNFELVRLSTTDQLTGVYNRRRLEEALEREVRLCHRYDRSVAVIMFDVDNFKQVNDTFGHHTGDRVLKVMAAEVSRSIRKTDIFGRWGGEEFLVIVPEFVENVMTFAEILRSRLAAVEFLDVGTVTVSLGVAKYKEKQTVSELLSQADKALYRAKERGRNRAELWE